MSHASQPARHANEPIIILLYHIIMSHVVYILTIRARCHSLQVKRDVSTRSLHAIRLPSHMGKISSIDDAFVEATGNVDVLVVHGTGWSCREGRASVQALGRPGWQCKAGNHSP